LYQELLGDETSWQICSLGCQIHNSNANPDTTVLLKGAPAAPPHQWLLRLLRPASFASASAAVITGRML